MNPFSYEFVLNGVTEQKKKKAVKCKISPFECCFRKNAKLELLLSGVNLVLYILTSSECLFSLSVLEQTKIIDLKLHWYLNLPHSSCAASVTTWQCRGWLYRFNILWLISFCTSLAALTLPCGQCGPSSLHSSSSHSSWVWSCSSLCLDECDRWGWYAVSFYKMSFYCDE